jgi:hypothetical protein
LRSCFGRTPVFFKGTDACRAIAFGAGGVIFIYDFKFVWCLNREELFEIAGYEPFIVPLAIPMITRDNRWRR